MPHRKHELAVRKSHRNGNRGALRIHGRWGANREHRTRSPGDEDVAGDHAYPRPSRDRQPISQHLRAKARTQHGRQVNATRRRSSGSVGVPRDIGIKDGVLGREPPGRICPRAPAGLPNRSRRRRRAHDRSRASPRTARARTPGDSQSAADPRGRRMSAEAPSRSQAAAFHAGRPQSRGSPRGSA